MIHIPVLLNEAISLLKPNKGEFFIDGTVGGGGHAVSILERILPDGMFLGIDWNKDSLERAKQRIETKFKIFWANDNFAELPKILKKYDLGKADGLILDLGFSSEQLEWSGRGFSFNRDEPLLMTYSDENEPVYRVLATRNEEELAEIIKNFSEEKYAEKIAKAIIKRNKIGNILRSSAELAEVIKNAVPENYEHGRIHPATRTFQALRIYVNKELENLENVLTNLFRIVKVGGRAAIISFHSLEDRMVKNYFRDYAKEGKVELLTKKPIVASKEEILKNPRSRSAKLRAVRVV